MTEGRGGTNDHVIWNVANCVFINNSGYGGVAFYGYWNVVNSIFSDNYSGGGGGVVRDAGGARPVAADDADQLGLFHHLPYPADTRRARTREGKLQVELAGWLETKRVQLDRVALRWGESKATGSAAVGFSPFAVDASYGGDVALSDVRRQKSPARSQGPCDRRPRE